MIRVRLVILDESNLKKKFSKQITILSKFNNSLSNLSVEEVGADLIVSYFVFWIIESKNTAKNIIFMKKMKINVHVYSLSLVKFQWHFFLRASYVYFLTYLMV